MKIALASDHAGFTSAKEIKTFLEQAGHEVSDYGPTSLNTDDDYPDYVLPAARALANGDCDAAIILGGSGQGEAIAANRIRGVRCAVFYSPAYVTAPEELNGQISNNPYEIIKLSRRHNLANALSLGVRFLNLGEIKRAIDVWLSEPLGSEERHLRRIKKIDNE